MAEQNNINIFLVYDEPDEGELIGFIEQDVLRELAKLAKEREALYKRADYLTRKNEQAIRQANKLMWRFIKSHGVKYDPETEAVGVSKSDLLYVGPKERVTKDPTAEPQDGDKVKTHITKAERRKYNELLESYAYLNEKIGEHNLAVEANELKLNSFGMDILKNHEFDAKTQYLVVSNSTGRVFLCSN